MSKHKEVKIRNALSVPVASSTLPAAASITAHSGKAEGLSGEGCSLWLHRCLILPFSEFHTENAFSFYVHETY